MPDRNELLKNLESLYNNDILRELMERYNNIPNEDIKEDIKMNMLAYKMEVEKMIRGISKNKSYLVINIINNNEKYNLFIADIFNKMDIKTFINKLKENRNNLLYLQEQYLIGDKNNLENYVNSIMEKFINDFE